MRYVRVLALVVVLIGLSVLPAAGQSSGEIPAQVTVQAGICITVDTTPIDFGSTRFSTSTDGDALVDQFSGVSFGAGHLVEAVNQPRDVISCSNDTQALTINGTDALITNQVAWNLPADPQDPFAEVHVCDPNANSTIYHLSQRFSNGPAVAVYEASAATAQLFAAETQTYTLGVVPACTGAAGLGQTLAMSFLFVATTFP